MERCVNVTDSLMARPNGSSASATARQHGFQLLLLLKLFSHQSCGHRAAGHAQLAAGAIETGRAAGEGVLGLARADRPRRHFAIRRGAGKPHHPHARIIGHAAMVRRSRTGHVVDMLTGRTQRHVAMALTLGRLSPGGLRTVLGGGSK